MIRLKRAYEEPLAADGFRVLVERFWPRDLDEKHARLDLWLKDVSPSRKLHERYGENPDPAMWDEFRAAYVRELERKRKTIKLLQDKMREGPLTLVHAAHNPDHSGAAVLKEFLEKQSAAVARP